MMTLTEMALERGVMGVFTRSEVACWAGGSPARQFNLIKRALASGEVFHLRRGLYHLAEPFARRKSDPLVVAQRIYGPSYVSLETALWFHGWIPEAVYTITSVSLDRSREFATPLGQFSFTRVPQKVLYAQVERRETGAGQSFLLASPLKALADYVYTHKADWDSARPVRESLRVEESQLESVAGAPIEELAANYSAARVRRFLEGLRKDLKR
jgi:hypothetical protein